MHEPERLAELAEDIRRHGLIEPIVLHGGKLLDGRNRLEACRLAGIEPRFEEHDGDPVAYVRSMNAMRRDLTSDQRRACLVDLEDLETDHRGGAQNKHETVSCLPHGHAADSVAKAMGESARTSHKAVIVKKKAPELHDAVKTGKLTHNLASKLADAPKEDREAVLDLVDQGMKPVRAHRQVSHARLAKASLELPEGVYCVIYADPPWQYGDQKACESYARLSAKNHYPDMATADVCALPVQDMAADNAVLFLWGTAPMLPDALEVIAAWGFDYKQHFVWYKGRRNLGHYHGCQHELLFLATRGACKPETDDRPNSVQTIKRTGRHSAKPEHFRELIDTLYPTGPRVELFRRGDAPEGWTVWGNESEAA
jgi:N6-adenosine-specific RNA methylase IME4